MAPDWSCPFCSLPDPEFDPEKMQFHCRRCHATGKHLTLIKRVLSKEAFGRLTATFGGKPLHEKRTCPQCRQSLTFFNVSTSDRKNPIGHCVPCRWVWSNAVDFLYAFAKSGPGLIEKIEAQEAVRDREDIEISGAD